MKQIIFILLITSLWAIANASMIDKITKTSTLELDSTLRNPGSNWRVWGYYSLDARVYYRALPNGNGVLGYTDNANTGHVVILDASDNVVFSSTWPDRIVRGIAVVPDDSYAVLLWDGVSRLWVSYQSITHDTVFYTELVNPENEPDDFGIGESRLEFGDGIFRAYYHVHGTSGFVEGHEGDSLKTVDIESGEASTVWSWGCSHSMSNLLSFHEPSAQHISLCVTDCFPGTGTYGVDNIGGIWINHNSKKIRDFGANCGGKVAAELGAITPTPTGWIVVYNGHQIPAAPMMDYTSNQDIGLTLISADDLSVSEVKWLTTTDDDEADAAIAPFSDGTYVVGFSRNNAEWFLTAVDESGNQVGPEEDVTSVTKWNKRGDPFVAFPDGSIKWVYANGNTIEVYSYSDSEPVTTATSAENETSNGNNDESTEGVTVNDTEDIIGTEDELNNTNNEIDHGINLLISSLLLLVVLC